MDIIPIIPAPQQGTPLHSVELPAGSGETGFSEIFGQAIPNRETSSQPGEKVTPLINNNNPEPLPIIPKEPTSVSLNESFPVSHSSKKSLVENNPNVTGWVPAGHKLSVDESIQLRTLMTTQDYVSHGDSDNLDDTDVFLSSGPLAESGSAPIKNLEPAKDWAQQNLSDVQKFVSANQSHEMILALNSTASAFSIKSTETVAITVQKTFINTDLEGIPPFLKSSLETRAGSSLPLLLQPDSSLPFPSGHHFNKGIIPDAGITVSHPPLISAFIKGQPDFFFTGQPSSTEQPSIMLGELQKLISQNNDSLKIDVSFESRITSPKTVGYLVHPAIQENPAPQISSNEILNKVNDGSVTATILNSPEILSLSTKEPLRNSIRETLHEMVSDSKSSVHEKHMANSNGTLQQNSNSTDNGTLQQQSLNTAQNSNSAATEQSTNSSFASQFHEIGSTQPAQNVKMATSPSPQLNFVRDQEIINQIVERFSVHSRLQTSRLSLQLNPAELGELKIEVIVKGDVLKANIYAQTHKAGEIIDKNIHRLRELLENQGISVEDLNVSFKSDNIDDFTSQHGQLFQDQTQFLKHQNKPTTTSKFEIEETLLTDADDQSGVNLTI